MQHLEKLRQLLNNKKKMIINQIIILNTKVMVIEIET